MATSCAVEHSLSISLPGFRLVSSAGGSLPLPVPRWRSGTRPAPHREYRAFGSPQNRWNVPECVRRTREALRNRHSRRCARAVQNRQSGADVSEREVGVVRMVGECRSCEALGRERACASAGRCTALGAGRGR